MPATRVPIEAILYATDYVKNMPLWRKQLDIIRDVSDYLWFAAPWRWTTGNLPNVTLVNNQQDYTITLPADFEYGMEAFLSNSTDRSASKDLEIVSTLPVISTNLKGQPTQVAITGSGASGQYRFYPIPSGYGANYPLPVLQGQYKKSSPTLTDTNIYTAGSLVLPDQYFYVFKLGVLAYAYKYADDQRAGSVTVQGNTISYGGARGEFEAAIQEMRQREKLPLAPYKYAPDPKIEKG